MTWPILLSLFTTQLVPHMTEPVRVLGGLLQGVISPDGKYMSYYGVPYATVHTRFQEAVPDPKWQGIMQATNLNIQCTQRFSNDPKIILGQENCLTVNVYAPLKKLDRLRSVMVFIHGGGFKQGSGTPSLYGPEYFLRQDIILVTLNYRLEILGFLCLGIHEAPGNVGLKDQVHALRWVQKNIKSFGGNPDDVTLFGESAGSVSVSYHLVSPMSKGLFGKAIMQSGTVLAPWALQYDPLEIAHKFAQQLGQDSEDLHELVKLFKDKSDKELLSKIIPRGPGEIALEEYKFVPCVEKEIPGVDSFLPEHPYNLISKGTYTKVPVIIGYNDEEGYWFVSKDNDTMLPTFDFLHSIPRNLKFASDNEKQKAANKLKSLYLPNSEISKETRIQFSKYVGDAAVIFPVTWTIDELVKISSQPVFAYKFTHDGIVNLAKTVIGYNRYPGASHGDELSYLFKNILPLVAPKADRDMINKMTTLWTNFAKYGDPTPKETDLLPLKWKAVNETNPQVFVLDNQFLYTPLYENDRLVFWKTLYMDNLKKM